MEINARAGLGVQIANLAPLRKKITTHRRGKSYNSAKVCVLQKICLETSWKKKSNNSPEPVIGTMEKIEIIQKHGTIRINAKIDTSKKTVSSMKRQLLKMA